MAANTVLPAPIASTIASDGAFTPAQYQELLSLMVTHIQHNGSSYETSINSVM